MIITTWYFIVFIKCVGVVSGNKGKIVIHRGEFSRFQLYTTRLNQHCVFRTINNS